MSGIFAIFISVVSLFISVISFFVPIYLEFRNIIIEIASSVISRNKKSAKDQLKFVEIKFIYVFGYDVWYYFNTTKPTDEDVGMFAQQIILHPVRWWFISLYTRFGKEKNRKKKTEKILESFYEKHLTTALKKEAYFVDGYKR
jgi:hypothetical protein